MTNKKLLLYILIYFSLLRVALPQGTWVWTMRTHPELDWFTLETKHFNIHYHNGIEDIAHRGASIAEQVWPTLLEQLDLEKTPKVDITFTAEDEIMNGYAMWSNQVFIWVDQNDAVIWLEDEKWLFQVIAHELQHIAVMNAVKTWIPEPWGIAFISGIPGWFVEGTAEYYTEKWRPYRADISHKWHILKNKTDHMDPHHDGFSKMKYWADRFGDSTIVKLIHHRNKLKLFRFKKAFKEVTGIELNQFEEDWRRHMNTYYYGYRSQKETFEEIGNVMSLPVKEASEFAISPDSMKIAIVGRNNKGQWDQSLFIAVLDTSKPKKNAVSKLLSSLCTTREDTAKKKKPKVKYEVEEIDYGRFGARPRWSPDGTKLAYAKYRYGVHGSLIWDIRVVVTETGKGQWLTKDLRAAHPDWSPDGEQIVFVAHHNGIANLYTIKPDGSGKQAITQFEDDTQLLTPRWSPDGKQIAYAASAPNGNCDIFILDVESRNTQQVTTDPAVDYLPVWHPGGKKITYTSHKSSTPNLHTVDLATGESLQVTDVGEAIWGVQWTPKGTTITASTLDDVDSVRVVQVDPNRDVTTDSLSVRESFSQWREKSPEHLLSRADPEAPVEILQDRAYRFYRHPKHFTWLMLPYLDLSGLFGVTAWTDGMGRHFIQAGGGTPSGGEEGGYFLSYLNAEMGPLWGISYISNAQWKFRFYDGGGLQERLDGWTLTMVQPHNFGTHQSSSHTLGLQLTLQDRQATLYGAPEDSLIRNLPVPESGREGLLSLQYVWLNRRPHKQNVVLPKQGWGMVVTMDVADSRVYGEFSYRRWTVDSFLNLPLGPAAFFLRGKGVSLSGSPPEQEYVGLSNDPPIYLPTGYSRLFGDFAILEENHNPRGWDGFQIGNRMVFGTGELRLPLIPKLPVNILGFSLGSVTGAVISDFGNAWYGGTSPTDWITTFGYGVKVALQAGDTPLAHFSLGYAQKLDEWEKQKEPRFYARMALINPF